MQNTIQTIDTIDTTKSVVQALNLQAFKEKGIEVYIKRDDLIHPLISGNKWRKLKYLITHANDIGIKKIVSFGGAYSNHLPAMALAAKIYGFESAAFVRGDELNANSNHRLSFLKSCGMNLHFTTRELYRDKQSLYNNIYGNDPETLFVDEGGKSNWAIEGCEEIVKEIDRHFDHIILPVGTGATLSGVVSGCHQFQPNAYTHGVVVLKGAEYLNDEVKKLIPRLSNYSMHHQFHEGGYAKKSIELENTMKQFYNETGIPTEHIYSGKMILAAYKLLQNKSFIAGDKIMLLHTGGVLNIDQP